MNGKSGREAEEALLSLRVIDPEGLVSERRGYEFEGPLDRSRWLGSELGSNASTAGQTKAKPTQNAL